VFFSYVECTVCSVFYCPVFYNQDQLSLLYANQPENMSEAPLEARRRTMEAYAAGVLRHARPDGTFLELGADIGLFAEVCARMGQFDRFVLYEPNKDVHNLVMERLKDQDLTIRSSGFSANDLPPESVSMAIMIHVLDHLLDPHAMLMDIYKVLKPGGILFIVVHDAQSLLARLLGNRWPPFTLQHPHLFSPRSIRRLLETVGMECVNLEKTSNYFPVTYLANAAFSILGLGSEVLPAWRQPMLRLRLGNLGMIARRPDLAEMAVQRLREN